jgi:hypothetical protein
MRARMLPLFVLALIAAEIAVAQPRTGPGVYRRTSSYTAPSPYQFVVEGGAAEPFGDLGEDFAGTERGLGAGTGYDLGARLRYFATETLAVGPSFHYANFGDWEGVFYDNDIEVAYAVRTSVFRYGVDVQQFLTANRAGLRPYVTVGVALCHNRYQDWDQDFGVFESSSTNLAVGAGAGLAVGPIELSAVYTYNPAKNRLLAESWGLRDTKFDWSYLVVRAGIAFGGF